VRLLFIFIGHIYSQGTRPISGVFVCGINRRSIVALVN
jgi:hypothetical protein